tara:strand:+ start:77 stop:559 length:483 start_codon:yes stop_codon:yes gene_type:complete
MSLYQHQIESATGELFDLKNYRHNVLLVVNTASHCGFTPQYKALEKVYQKYKNQGLEILAFPCNQFGKQEPGTESDILSFCTLNYQVSFPIFKKIEVNGQDALPLFKDLKEKAPGFFKTKKIKWNFTKFLVARDAQKVKRYAPQISPLVLQDEIEKFLSL